MMSKKIPARRAIVTMVTYVAMTAGVLMATDANAWGNEGHQVVCAIAYQLLPASKKRELTRRTREYRLPRGEPYRYYTGACTFADRARSAARDRRQGWSRFGRFEDWHFLNVSRNTEEIESGLSCDDCVLYGLEFHIDQSVNMELPEWNRTEALFFIGHWVGDIHQPLHVSYWDDRGGTRIDSIRGGYYGSRNLHAVWDSGILSGARGNRDWWTHALELVEEIRSLPPEQLAAWKSATHSEWAAESYTIATSEEVDYCRWTDTGCVEKGRERTLDEDYQLRFEPVVNERLMKAGVRLAELLDSAL